MNAESLVPLTQCEWQYMSLSNGRLTDQERQLFSVVKHGDVPKAKYILQNEGNGVNCNLIYNHMGQQMTLLQLAAEADDYHMVKLLIDSGANRLDYPRPSNGVEDITDEDARFRRYVAISSPAYLSLAHRDPLLAAINLTGELRNVSESREINVTTQGRYNELRKTPEKYAVEILDCCVTSLEVKTLLLGNGDNRLKKGEMLRSAIAARNKEFIAHYKCQNIVRNIWHRGQPEWYRRNAIHWLIIYVLYCCLFYVILLPFFAIVYIVAPTCSLASILDSPKAKFITQMVSYVVFLILVLILNMLFDKYTGDDLLVLYVPLLLLALVYDIALLWAEMTQMMIYGPTKYFFDFWNYVDLLILFSFLVDISLRILHGYFLVDIPDSFFLFWFTWTGISITFACLRLMENLYLSSNLGPMMLMFSAMKADVVRFLVIFTFAVMSFAIGFYYIFDGVEKTQFNNFGTTIATLITAIFGGDPTNSLNVVVLVNNTSNELYDASALYKGLENSPTKMSSCGLPMVRTSSSEQLIPILLNRYLISKGIISEDELIRQNCHHNMDVPNISSNCININEK
uniref:Short transient receptor potential channel 4-like n=1 Tax=Saccoglossus kowalevskii TaxID=10224 RepID=A0ABM0MU14_SACKO|nr:PREDICTED: short transient receptor potential channel 4-like [Saccoglossus kowalevskii]